jgi:hypothetical protein
MNATPIDAGGARCGVPMGFSAMDFPLSRSRDNGHDKDTKRWLRQNNAEEFKRKGLKKDYSDLHTGLKLKRVKGNGHIAPRFRN